MSDRKVRPRARDGSPKGRDRVSGLGSRQPGDRPKGRAGARPYSWTDELDDAFPRTAICPVGLPFKCELPPAQRDSASLRHALDRKTRLKAGRTDRCVRDVAHVETSYEGIEDSKCDPALRTIAGNKKMRAADGVHRLHKCRLPPGVYVTTDDRRVGMYLLTCFVRGPAPTQGQVGDVGHAEKRRKIKDLLVGTPCHQGSWT